MFEELAREIKEVAALEPDTLDDEALTAAVVELAHLEARFTAARNRLTGAWDRRGAWRHDGARSATAALATQTREPKAECGSRLWLERALRHLPLVHEALGAGDITIAHARSLARARNPRTAVLLVRDQAMLLDHAMRLSFGDFSRVLDYWMLHADPDGAEESDMERRARRHVNLDETIDGAYAGTTFLDPISGAIVATELQRLEQALFETDWAEAKARLGRDPRPGELARTPGNRRADALVEMAQRSAIAPADGKLPKPLFQILLGSDAFSHLTQLASGQVLPPTALLPWLASADIERYLFDGTPQRVISVSYRRSFQGALRDLIKVRDQFCYHHTCDIPAHRCQIDHIDPHSAGGITSQHNGRLACGYHNRLRHRRPPPPAG
jgi:hypothetical protein